MLSFDEGLELNLMLIFFEGVGVHPCPHQLMGELELDIMLTFDKEA